MSRKPTTATADYESRSAGDRFDSKFGVSDERGEPGTSVNSTDLDSLIRQRIRQRLGDRVHDLKITVDDDSVLLRGRCATFYTKQLAQHAALGVLNHELLVNEIEVTVR